MAPTKILAWVPPEAICTPPRKAWERVSSLFVTSGFAQFQLQSYEAKKWR